MLTRIFPFGKKFWEDSISDFQGRQHKSNCVTLCLLPSETWQRFLIQIISRKPWPQTSRIPSAECRNNRNFTLHEKLSTQFPRRTYACFCENKTKQSLIKQILKKLKQNLPVPTNMSNRYMIVNEYFQYGKNWINRPKRSKFNVN